MPPKPITIIGGGLAGLTLGIGLRRYHIPVTIWEAGRYPRHRVCGEFISGRGHETLARLSLREQLIEAGAITASTAMFLSGNAKSPARPLPKPALCLSRFVLDAMLANVFRELGGDLRENERWRENGFAEGAIRANGRRAQATSNGWHWFGLKVHARNLPLQADLEMHIIKNGYVGLTRLPNNEVDVCGLFRHSYSRTSDSAKSKGTTSSPSDPQSPFSVVQSQRDCALQPRVARNELPWVGTLTSPNPERVPPLTSLLPRGWHDVLSSHSSTDLRSRLSNASFDETSSCSVAALSLRPQRAAAQRELCIGDSLTMTPPVTGNGMSMAFESAELAIEPLVSYSRGEIDWPQARHTIALACDRAFTHRLAWARVLQWMMFSPIFKGPLAVLVLRSNWLWQTMFTNTR
jgi:menaquinone-9 beta-reductase